MPKVHMTMQPKGGVGKSFVAALIAEHLAPRGNGVVALDTDLSNGTFLDYREFGVTLVPLIKDKKVVQGQFDVMMGYILRRDQDVVIDTGANTYHPLSAYMVDNKILDLLEEMGRTVAIHVPLTSSVRETLSGLHEIVSTLVIGRESPPEVFVWFNGFNGDLVEGGVPIEKMADYVELLEHISGVISIPKFEESTGDAAIKQIIAERRSFAAKIKDKATDVIVRWRLQQLKAIIMDEVTKAQI